MNKTAGTVTVGQLGERGVLARILAQLTAAHAATLGPGDDCAVIGDRPGFDTVITTDTMIEGPDFRLPWHAGFELGWKLAATNLSDVAAMGATPTALTLSLAVPQGTEVAFLEQIAEGLDAACRTLAPGCGVVGGDLGTAPVIMAAVTALGQVAHETAVTRSGASEGDIVAYAGELGLAGLGLSLLFSHAADDGVAHSRTLNELWAEHPELLSAQLAPAPPIPLGPIAAAAGATAMMDVSDGLALDGARLARASDVALHLDGAALTTHFGTQYGLEVPVTAMLEGGEDHGLLTTFPAATALPVGFHQIGRVGHRAAGDPELLLNGTPYAARGWDPFAPIALNRRG
ncbi:thiamine-monophosphate kinase [Leucobacter exalbidus]|uniref:Thiamine-monophosphate kinase n=1 Tax=Leucobacter exalbidus TaxID=662960 RepID=A0A940PVG3_9MICO|nr:thiamine-monophosphate kinase [Leucobacter exalbidus]